ncbi:hypothetical protein MHBO_002877 [Bonamia ostreae]|uniref:Uncharacterized protein n=1 Tax=Bonamia ostreae TaxID=126728 RepID=A0ABV2ANT7_9EUKA
MDNSFLVICLDRDKTHSLSPLYNSQKTPNSKQKEISEKIDYIGGNKTHSIKSNSNEYAERLCKLINLYYDKYEFEEKHLVLVHVLKFILVKSRKRNNLKNRKMAKNEF